MAEQRNDDGRGPDESAAAIPDTPIPDAATPDTATPDAASPDAAAPDTAIPDTAIPDTASPDTAPTTITPGADAVARWLGPVLVLASAVLFSFSGVLTKAIDAGSWTILGWRGVVGGAGIAAYVWWRNRDRSLRSVFRLGPDGWILATVGGIGSITFIFAFKNTFVANVSVIYATIPFVAALLERLVLGQPIRRRTIGAATASIIGVVVIVGGSLGSPNLEGDAVAIAMVLLNALYMVLIRTFTGTDPVLAGAASGPLLFAAGWWFDDLAAVTARDAALLVVFGLVFAAASVLWIEGTRRIPAAESGLLGSAETPIAIAMAWIIIGEHPPLASVAGAAIVLVTIVAHARPDIVSARSAGDPSTPTS